VNPRSPPMLGDGNPGIVGHSEVIVEPALRGDKLPTPDKS
jgi:hypothetical protein